MEAPERIYFSTQAVHPFYGLTRKCADDDIEYVRLDAFIEKAYEYLEPILTEYAGFYVGGDILQHFKNYMKGK